MAQPTQTAVHVDAVLTNISVAYIQAASHFIARQVFPSVRVSKQTNKYFTYTKNDWYRDEAQARADSSESAGSGYGLSTATYSCDVFAMHKDIGEQVAGNADAPLNMERDATEFVTQRLLLRQEIQWVADAFATSVWGTDSTPSNLWSDQTASNPIGDIETGKRTILVNTGYMPNTLVLGYDVWIQLLQHPDLIDRLKYTSSESITTTTLARLFGIDRVLVAMAVKATNVEGETAAMAFTHGKHALLCYSAPTPGLLAPSAGYTFVWDGVSGGMGAEVGIKQIPAPLLAANRIEGQTAFDNKIVATDLGYFYASVVA